MKTFLITEEEKQRILGMHKTATSRHYLNEVNQVLSATVTIPMIKDEKGNKKLATNQYIVLQLSNIEGEYDKETNGDRKMSELDTFKSIKQVLLNGNNITGRASGVDKYFFTISDRKIQNELVGLIGKKKESWDANTKIEMNKLAGGTEILSAGVFYTEKIIPAQK